MTGGTPVVAASGDAGVRLGELRAEFEGALAATDTVAAVALMERALADQVDPVRLLVDVIAPAQRQVGVRWQQGEWSVAEEHAATAIAVAATEAVARVVRATPVTHGRVVVACAEREWHALPAMIVDCALRANGWNTTLLGASTSPVRLSQYLQDLGPDALAVSCSMLGALPTTRRFVEAATSAGIPAVVGGAAFGPDPDRALALGATAWAPDAESAVRAIGNLPAVVPAVEPLPAEPAAEQAALELDHRALVAEIGTQWRADPELDIRDDAVQQTLHSVWAALLTGDTRPVPETAEWIRILLTARAADPTLAADLGAATAAVLRDYPLAHRLVSTTWPTS
ncbi:methanogenic corrinoid protein MtbC1 [Kribbella amoyensis]|uniref:Methanogenic corrinoid protein MtbC1 n=1 Tax=Kribbella amoyensis TaxID=996641 RepID=A0A561BLM1_9ACTN|nr:cobalamin-dependent protein [Kribbella amoyensis]TWD79759.1 methanogenic corrinoid protein MtbC1 [Kribbella amoyensis]